MKWLAVVVVCAVLAFAPALRGSWLYDDHALIEHAAHVHTIDPAAWFGSHFFATGEDLAQVEGIAYWRPAVSASYALDWQLGGGSPGWFHAMNLLWHAVAAGLAFLALRRWLASDIPAALAAILVMVHPTKAESVAWISGRTDAMCAVFMLVAAAGMARRFRGQRGGIALELGGTIAAYLTKEQAVVLPLFAVVEAWAVARGPLQIKLLRAAVPQLAVAIAYLTARAIWLPLGGGTAVPIATHAAMVLESYGRFATLAIAPRGLSIQHAVMHTVGGELQISTGYAVLGAAFLLAAGAGAWLLRARRPAIALGLLCFVAALAPTANLATTGLATLISERFLYLPLLGLGLAVGSLLVRREARLLAIALCVALGMLALARSADFADEDAFWARERGLHPDSEVAQHFALEQAVGENGFRDALAILGDIQRIPYDRSHQVEIESAYLAASIGARLVPDLDRATLGELDAFVAATLAGKPAKLTKPIAFASRGGDARLFAPRLLILRALIASRLGDDTSAVALAAQAGAMCPTCSTIRGPELEVLAGAGLYDRASALAAQLRGSADAALLAPVLAELEHARTAGSKARACAAVGLWGRAYALASDDAEYAFKAGDPGAARRLRATGAQMRQWSDEMGWSGVE